MIVIGLIGPKSVGKDTLARHIVSRYGGKNHAHSEILDQILRILKLPVTRENAIRLVALRKSFGESVLVDALNNRIKADNAELEVVTGIRYDTELKNIRSYPQNVVLYIDAPIEKRYAWQKGRHQRDDDKDQTFEEFTRLEKRETEIHIQELGAKADYLIVNDGDLDQLFAKVDQLLDKILKKDAA